MIWNVNSTARGGGVAEMLASLLAYTRGRRAGRPLGRDRRGPDFFRVTKRIHNMLHGARATRWAWAAGRRAVFRETAARNARELGR